MARSHIGIIKGKKLFFDLDNLTRHAAIVGTTGSGKTVMGKVILEEALMRGIPIIAIDPKGDIGGLGINNRDFDFRPFSGTKQNSERVAGMYLNNLKETQADNFAQSLQSLQNIRTTIFTPKSNAGRQLSLMPDLCVPEDINGLQNETALAEIIDPLAESIIELAEIIGAKRGKAQSLISAIIIDNWKQNLGLTFGTLIEQIIIPKFSSIGSLSVDDFLSEKDRRGIAASVNLITSSPSKRVWSVGEKLDMEKILSRNTLSIIDLRFTGSMEEKQFVVEQILQKLYLFILRNGGSEKLRYILYIDELAGLLPAPPANPACKKMLEVLVRQARAFGVGVILSTQSPGDIDYRILGNVGTRFVGKLRTEIEIEKVAIAMNITPSDLRQKVGSLSTGDFILNDAVKNTNKQMHARWLLSYHAGPLKEQEIAFVNNPETMPKMADKLEPLEVKKKKASIPVKHEPARDIIRKLKKTRKSRKEKPHMITQLANSISNYADKVKIKATIERSTEYTPHLRIVLEPRKLKDFELNMQGPYVFDLTTKIIPLHNYLKSANWGRYVNPNIPIAKPSTSIKRAFDYALFDAVHNLTSDYYSSTIMRCTCKTQKEVVEKNYNHLLSQLETHCDRLNLEKDMQISKLRDEMTDKNRRINKYVVTAGYGDAKKFVSSIFSKKKFPVKQSNQYKKIVARLRNENNQLNAKINSLSEQRRKQISELKDKAYLKAYKSIRVVKFKPSRRDFIVHATILLVAKKEDEI